MIYPTAQAMNVVYDAFEEARRMGDNWVSTEHLLLGLLHPATNSACQALQAMNVSLIRIRAEIERRRASSAPYLVVELTPCARRVLALAQEETRLLNHPHIMSAHILLGLIREGEGLAARVLENEGVALDQARDIVAQVPQENISWEDHNARGELFARCWRELTEAQRQQIQAEGLPLNQLPVGMQEAVVNIFARHLPVGVANVVPQNRIHVTVGSAWSASRKRMDYYTISVQAAYQLQIGAEQPY